MIKAFTGGNLFELQAEIKRLVNKFKSENGELSVEKIDCEEAEYNQITEAIQGLSFLYSKKLVVLNRPGTQKQFVENFERLIESIPDSVDVVIVEPKPDKRSTYFKLLHKKTDFKSFDELGPRELPAWLIQQAKARGGSLSQNDARYLVERIGANQLLLSNELDKLLLYEPQVSRQYIDTLTEPSPQSTVFNLIDAAFSGNTKRVMEIYVEQRAQKVEPMQIIAMLAWQLNVLAIVKAAGNKPLTEVASESGLSYFVLQKSQPIASSLSMLQLKQIIGDLQDLDVKTKTIAIDPDEALQNYLLKLASKGL